MMPCTVNSVLYDCGPTSWLPVVGELRADRARERAADQEERERGDAVEHADLLVVGGGEPGDRPGLRAIGGPAHAALGRGAHDVASVSLRATRRTRSAGTTRTVNVMYAWCRPQNSEQTPW